MKKLLSVLLSVGLLFSFSACADLSEDSKPANTNPPSEQEQTYTVTANYDYGMHRPGLATILYSYSTLFFTLPEGYDPVVAGDEFTVTYTGQLLIQESYPSSVVITDGEITKVTAEPAVIRKVRYNVTDQSLTLLDENGEAVTLETGSIQFPEYYLIGIAGDYAELSSLTEDTILYGSISPTEQKSDGGITFSGLYKWNPRKVDPEMQAKIRAITDPMVQSNEGITDLSCYNIQMDYADTVDRYTVKYDLTICGYHTDESVYISLESDLTVYRYSAPDSGKFSRYLAIATPKAVEDAKKRILEKIGDQSANSGFYMRIDEEGYLCLSTELIVPIDPPKPDEDGNLIGGCGYDHDHVFYIERICKAD